MLAARCHHHMIVVDSGCVKNFDIHFVPEIWFIVTVGESWGEGNIAGLRVFVYHEKQGSRHILASETDSTP